jgi:hypothetical protein
MESYRMETPNVTAYWDGARGIFYVIYRGILSADVTKEVYQWMTEKVALVKGEEIRGGIYDFRQVTDSNVGNLTTLHRESRNFNVQIDTSQTPIALVVETIHQEQIVRFSMQVTPGHGRKRIVKSMDEAHKFINDYHARQTKTD